MARPMKNNLDYFSHDTDAVNDEKIELFRSAFGNDGYAFYFILLERIYRADGAKLDLSKNIFIVGLANKIMVSVQKFNEMLETAFELEIFDLEVFQNEKVLTSKGIQKRFDKIMGERQKQRAKKSAKTDDNQEFSPVKIDDNQEFSPVKTVGEMPQRKGNRKEKEIKGDNNKKDISSDSNESNISVFSSDIYTLNNKLIEKMKINNDKSKIPSNLDKWLNAIKLMIETDGYTFEQVEKMIEYSQGDEFWKANILSATKLREKAGTLVLQMNRGGSGAKHRNSSEGTHGENSKYPKFNASVSPERIAELQERARKREEEERIRMQQVSG